jgi:hypothetical protein
MERDARHSSLGNRQPRFDTRLLCASNMQENTPAEATRQHLGVPLVWIGTLIRADDGRIKQARRANNG